MTATARPASWKILLAFGIIYFVWGSTFLAIRIGVHEVPPLLLAGIRFFLSGLVMFAWMRVRRTPWPSFQQWVAASLLGFLIFVVDYGCLFWAEQRVPSGIAAVILATIPVFVTLFEITLLRTQRLTMRLSLALAIGLLGVAVLMNRSFSLGEMPIDRRGALALLVLRGRLP
jgi:drug/metabolite transporter (DMT)-like permease